MSCARLPFGTISGVSVLPAVAFAAGPAHSTHSAPTIVTFDSENAPVRSAQPTTSIVTVAVFCLSPSLIV